MGGFDVLGGEIEYRAWLLASARTKAKKPEGP